MIPLPTYEETEVKLPSALTATEIFILNNEPQDGADDFRMQFAAAINEHVARATRLITARVAESAADTVVAP